MRQTRFTFLLLALPVVLLVSLLASCSEEGIMDSPMAFHSADKDSFEIPDDPQAPDPMCHIPYEYLKKLNMDFINMEWDTLALTFDLKGDYVSVGPLYKKITLTVTAENDSLLSLSGPQMHTLKILAPAAPEIGSEPIVTTGHCTLYQFSSLPNIRGVTLNLSLPMEGPDDMTIANSYWILGLGHYTRPKPISTTAAFGHYYYTFDLPDWVDRPDRLNKKVLDPGVPGEIQ